MSSISDKFLTYIDNGSLLTQSMITYYNNSMIVIGDERQAFIPILNSYIGGIGKSTYSYIMNMIAENNITEIPIEIQYIDQNKDFNLIFTYNINSNNDKYTIYSDDELVINPYTNTIKYTYFQGDLKGNALTADKLKSKVNLWGNEFDGSSNIGGNIIPSANAQQTIGNSSKHFSYAYINSVVGHLYGEADEAKHAATSDLSNTANKIYNIKKSDNGTYSVIFTDNSGNNGIYSYSYINSNLNYNPSTGKLTSTYFVGWLQGTADDTIKLKTARKINGTNFNGTSNIVTMYWGNARNFTIKDYNNTYSGTTVSVHGDADIVLNLPETICANTYGTSYKSSYSYQSSYSSYSYMSTYSYYSYVTKNYNNNIYPVTFAMINSTTNYYSYDYVTKEMQMNIPAGMQELQAIDIYNIELIKFKGFKSGLYYLPGDNNTGALFSTYFRGILLGTAAYADALYNVVKINGTDFDGSVGITTTYWGNARDFTIKDYNNTYSGTKVSVHGDSNIVLNLPNTICANIYGTSTYSITSGLSDNSNKIYNIDKTDNNNYKILFTRNTGNTGIYSYSYVNSNLNYNPSTGKLTSTYFVGWLQGTADETIKLKTARKINGTNFNGTTDITTSSWGTARNITVSDYHSTYTQANNNINGGSNFTLKLPENIHANLHGNADTANYSTVSSITNNSQRVKVDTINTNGNYNILFTNASGSSTYSYLYIDKDDDTTTGLNYNPATNEIQASYMNAVKLFKGKLRAADQWGTL